MNSRTNKRIRKKQRRTLSPGQLRRLRARMRDLDATIDRQYGIVRIAETHGMQSRAYRAAHAKLRAMQHRVADLMRRHFSAAVALAYSRDVADAIWRAKMLLGSLGNTQSPEHTTVVGEEHQQKGETP